MLSVAAILPPSLPASPPCTGPPSWLALCRNSACPGTPVGEEDRQHGHGSGGLSVCCAAAASDGLQVSHSHSYPTVRLPANRTSVQLQQAVFKPHLDGQRGLGDFVIWNLTAPRCMADEHVIKRNKLCGCGLGSIRWPPPSLGCSPRWHQSPRPRALALLPEVQMNLDVYFATLSRWVHGAYMCTSVLGHAQLRFGRMHNTKKILIITMKKDETSTRGRTGRNTKRHGNHEITKKNHAEITNKTNISVPILGCSCNFPQKSKLPRF